MTDATIKEVVFAFLALLVLAAFVWLFAIELWNALFDKKKVAPPSLAEIENPRLYVTTAVAALVGGVAAVFLGIEGGEGAKTISPSGWSPSDWIRVAYVVSYVLFGATAIIAWVKNTDKTTLQIRNLAVTFIGLVTPAVAAYLGSKSGVI